MNMDTKTYLTDISSDSSDEETIEFRTAKVIK